MRLQKTLAKGVAAVVTAGAILLTSVSSLAFAQGNAGSPYGMSTIDINSPLVQRYLLRDNTSEKLLIEFEIQVNFDNVTKEELYAVFSERTLDDAWYKNHIGSQLPLVTVVTDEGQGSRNLGREWQQTSDFGGFPVTDTITRVWADKNNTNVDFGTGEIADYILNYSYADTEAGASLTYRGVYEPSPALPLDEAGLTWFFGLVVMTFEHDMLDYFGTTGSAQLNQLDFYHI